MLKMLEVMEDIAMLNSQINKYKLYVMQNKYCSKGLKEHILVMMRKRDSLKFKMRVMAFSL